MGFFNIFGFIGLLAIPIIIMLHMIKPKTKTINVSSLYLWNKIKSQNDNQNSVKKIRKNLLMLLQILIVLTIVTSIAKPYIVTKAEVTNSVILIDASASMQTKYKNSTRFEYAKKAATDFIIGLDKKASISIIQIGSESNIIVSEENDKEYLVKKINELECGFSSINYENLEAVLSVFDDGINIYSFSDNKINIDNVNNNIIGENEENTAITSVVHNIDSNRINVLVKVKNFGTQKVEKNINLYCDNKIFDYKTIDINFNEEKNIIFTGIDLDTKEIKAVITPEDALEYDDIRFDFINSKSINKVFLDERNSFFIEKALNVIPNLDVYKGDKNSLLGQDKYNLYIFNENLPEVLPKDGHIIIFNPSLENNIIKTEDNVNVNNIYVKNTDFLKFITDINFYISSSKKLIIDESWQEILGSNETPLIVKKEIDNQKIIVFGFELSNTDLPLKKEFPVFVYNIIDHIIPSNIIQQSNIVVGDNVEINSHYSSQNLKIISPTDAVSEIKTPIGRDYFQDTNDIGIYTIEQTINDNKVYNGFAVNINTESESDIKINDLDNTEIVKTTIKSEFNNYIQWFLILIIIILLLLELYIYNKRKIIIKGIRTIIIAIIIISVCDININISSKNINTIFAVDVSKSMDETKDTILEFINTSIKNRGKNDYIGMVSFAGNSKVESTMNNYKDVYSLNSFVDTDFTDISSALNLSKTLFDESARKRIVLFSDGLENSQDAIKTAKLLNENGIKIDVVPIENKIKNEVQLSNMDIPKNINKNMRYNINIRIDSTVNTETRLVIYKENKIISNKDVTITQGENNFVIEDIIDDVGGIITYKAEIQSDIDTIYENNVFYTYSYVKDIPNILIVENDNSANEIESIVSSTGSRYTVVDASQVPETIEQLNKFDAIIIADCSLESFNDKFLNNIEVYVKNLAGGLLVTGGENSFALGDYKNSIFEKILPVDMDIKNKGENDNIGLVIVFDRSGSMGSNEFGVSKLSLAKEAIIRSVETITENDYISILSFDDIVDNIIDFQKKGSDDTKIKNKIEGVSLGGGTSILPALEEGYKQLENADTVIKHIILLTDGQAETSGYDSILKKINDNNITLSTVAVGNDADKELLKRLSDRGNGRYYFTDEFTDLPKIFAKETNIAAKDYINNVYFSPEVNNSSSLLKGVTNIPFLNGYVSTSAKDMSSTVLSYEEEPILSTWQYGLGKTAVWTSDFNNWSGHWLGSDDGLEITKNLISYIIRNQNFKEGDISTQFNGKNTKIIFNVEDASDITNVNCSITGENYKDEFKMNLVSANTFETILPFNKTGTYILNILIERDGKTDNLLTAVNIPYSDEFNLNNFKDGKYVLNQLAYLTGGNIIKNPEEVFYNINDNVYEKKSLNNVFLSLALILFIIELVFRRMNIQLNIFKNKKVLKDLNINIKKDKVFVYNKKSNKEKADDKTKENKIDTSSLLISNKKNRKGGK